MKKQLFYWICDKAICKNINYRTLDRQTLITDDECDNCCGRIHEPRTFKYNKELEPKNGNKKEA